MADAVVPPSFDDDDDNDELEVEELEDVAGGIVAPTDELNSGCTINGNCGCQV